MKVFSKKQLYLFSILSGLLLWLGWPAHGFSFLLLIAFVPLLIIEEQLKQEGKKNYAIAYFKYAYTSMLLWNALTTWWVCNATIVGGLAAIICNALFMAMVLVLFHYVKMKTSSGTGYAALVFFWISFEYIHLNWELSWPWLTLGFGFANYARCVEWYEFTGILGGSLWILICNILIFYILKYLWLSPWKGDNKVIKRTVVGTAALIFLPLLLSLLSLMLVPTKNKYKHVNVVIIQPNIDPYGDKFNGDYQGQLKKMLELADKDVDSTTDYLVFPETALTENIDESRWNDSYSIKLLRDYLASHPKLSIIAGAESYRVYPPGAEIPESAHPIENSNQFYDDYNTAIELSNSSPVQVYHKCKLVPGVEIMPFQKLLAPLAKLAFDLGGTSGTLGTQKEPSVFTSNSTIAPSICYESIYGEWMSKFVQKGAEAIFIITNDGWWKDTPGYRQHFEYARLLAIETNRCLAQCANTGISGYIDEHGNVLQKTNWWQPDVIKSALPIHSELTFYVQYGDYIGKLACTLSALVLTLLLFIILRGKKS